MPSVSYFKIPNNVKKAKNGIKIAHWNIRTLLPNLDEISHVLHSKQIHILCLNETRLSSLISDSEIAISGYSLVRNDRNRHGGGVAIYISNNIHFNVRDDLNVTSKEVIWLSIKINHQKPFLLACLYRPPSVGQNEFFSYLIENIESASCSW